MMEKEKIEELFTEMAIRHTCTKMKNEKDIAVEKDIEGFNENAHTYTKEYIMDTTKTINENHETIFESLFLTFEKFCLSHQLVEALEKYNKKVEDKK